MSNICSNSTGNSNSSSRSSSSYKTLIYFHYKAKLKTRMLTSKIYTRSSCCFVAMWQCSFCSGNKCDICVSI